MLDTNVGGQQKMPADEVARIGFKARLAGEGDVVAGVKNKITAAVASITPSARFAEQQRACQRL
jgi:hypothetical protein